MPLRFHADQEHTCCFLSQDKFRGSSRAVSHLRRSLIEAEPHGFQLCSQNLFVAIVLERGGGV